MLTVGRLAIDAEPLLTAAALEAAGEAMAELRIPGAPASLWLVEQDDVNAQLAGRLPGVAEVAVDRHPLGMSIYRVGEPAHVLVQRGIPALVERVIIRHELCHLAQARAGRLEVFDAGELGRWYVLPAGSVQAIDAGGMPALEVEADRFALDARYWADRIAEALIRLGPEWSVRLERIERGRYEWRWRRYADGELVEELVPATPSAAARASTREAADVFLAAARRDPTLVEKARSMF